MSNLVSFTYPRGMDSWVGLGKNRLKNTDLKTRINCVRVKAMRSIADATRRANPRCSVLETASETCRFCSVARQTQTTSNFGRNIASLELSGHLDVTQPQHAVTVRPTLCASSTYASC